MPIEAFGNIDDLDPANPLVDDPVSEGDDHMRGLKLSLKGNVTGDNTETRLLAATLVKLLTTDKGVTVTGQVLVSDPAPLNPDELTRKDYVDGLIASLQAEINDIKNGFAFTGPISAPTVTEV